MEYILQTSVQKKSDKKRKNQDSMKNPSGVEGLCHCEVRSNPEVTKRDSNTWKN